MRSGHETARGPWLRVVVIFAAGAGLMLLLSRAVSADACPRCRGAKTVQIQCRACAGTGILQYVSINGEPAIHGCQACGGKAADREAQKPGKAGSGRITVKCDRCGGTGVVNPPTKEGVCWQCRGNKTITCPACGGSGYSGFVDVHGQQGAYGCERCGGARGNLDGTGRRGSGYITCPTCRGTGRAQVAGTIDYRADRDAEAARRAAEQNLRAAKEEALQGQLDSIRSEKQRLDAAKKLVEDLKGAGPSVAEPSSGLAPSVGVSDGLTPRGAENRSRAPGIQPEGPMSNAEIERIMAGFKDIRVPTPLLPDVADVRLQVDSAEAENWGKLLFLDGGVAVADVAGKIGERSLGVATCILAAGKTFIAMEDGADLYLMRKGEQYERALKWLRGKETGPEFSKIVHALRDGRPLPADAREDMIPVARAILDPKLGNSGQSIAWGAMWSPEARRAGITRALIEIGADRLGAGTKGVVQDLWAEHDAAFRYASGALSRAQAEVARPASVAHKEAVQKVIAEANRVLSNTYTFRASGASDHISAYLGGLLSDKMRENLKSEEGK